MKTVGKLFLEIAALLVFLVLLTGFLEWKYASYRTQADMLMEEFQKKKSDAEILWLGNSHTIPLVAEFDTLHLQPPSASFAYGGMDLFWSAVLLEKYKGQMPRLKTLCIGVDEELLGYNQTFFKLEYINRALFRYTDTLDDDSRFDRLLASSNFFRTNRDISYLVNKRNQPSDLKPMLQGFFQAGSMDQQSRQRAKENSITRFSKKLIPKNLFLLKKIVETAKASGIDVLLFTSPKSASYIHYRDSSSIESSRLALRDFTVSENVIYKNGNRFQFPDSLFADPDHLNKTGAKIFLDSLNEVWLEKKGELLFKK